MTQPPPEQPDGPLDPSAVPPQPPIDEAGSLPSDIVDYPETPTAPTGYGPGMPPTGYWPGASPPGYGPPAYPPPGYGPPAYPPPGYGPPAYPPPGYSPSAYPPPGYSYPPSSGFDIGAAVSWATNMFGRRLGPLLLSALAYLAAPVIAILVPIALLGVTDDWIDPVVIVVFVAFLLGGAAGLPMYTAGILDIADGRPVTVRSFFTGRNLLPGFLTTLAIEIPLTVLRIALASLGPLGSLLDWPVSLMVWFFTQFAVMFAVDRALSPVKAIQAGIRLCWDNPGDALLAFLVQCVLLFVGSCCCGIGLLFTAPLALLVNVYAYRTLTHGRAIPTWW